LEQSSCDEIRAGFLHAKYLIVLLDLNSLTSVCIKCAIHHFEDSEKRNNIIPVFAGEITPSTAVKSSLIRKFGNHIIQSQDIPFDELVNAVYTRLNQNLKIDPGISCKYEQSDDTPESNHTFRIKNSIVKILSGSVLQSKCDIIVSSDDNMLSHGGGVSKAIFNHAGDTIFNDMKKNIPADLGDIIVTSAGNLPQKYIFHAITIVKKNLPKIMSDQKIDWADIQEYVICNAVRKSFSLLSILNITSIAFPLIGTGRAEIPFRKALENLLSAFSEQINKTAKPLLVELWIYQNNECDINTVAKKQLIDKASESTSSLPSDPLQTEYDIFISYSRIDTEKTNEIIDFLKEKHFRYWRDVDGSYSGNNYKSIIVQAIKKSQIVIFISSENSNKSPHVEKEISIAVEEKKKIIPIKLDSSKYSDTINYDLSNIDFINWTKSDPDHRKKIYLSICSFLAGSTI